MPVRARWSRPARPCRAGWATLSSRSRRRGEIGHAGRKGSAAGATSKSPDAGSGTRKGTAGSSVGPFEYFAIHVAELGDSQQHGRAAGGENVGRYVEKHV